MKLFNKFTLFTMVYRSETWTLTKSADKKHISLHFFGHGMIHKLQTAQKSMERSMLGITRRQEEDTMAQGSKTINLDNRWTKCLME